MKNILSDKCQPCADNNYTYLPRTVVPYRRLESRESCTAVTQRNKISVMCITLGVIVLLVLITVLIISTAHLYSKCYEMDSEISQMKTLINEMDIKRITSVEKAGGIDHVLESTEADDNDYSGDEEFDENREVDLSRGKRSTRTRHRNKKERRQRESDNKNVVHFIINERHEDIDVNHPDLRTKERGAVIPYWKFSDNKFNYDQNFATLNEPDGTVTVKKSGMYFIYSQVTYFDRSGRWSHMISVDDQPFIKCLASEWGIEVDPDTGVHFNTIHQCYTAAVTHVAANKKIKLHGMYPDRVIHPDRELTYWGVVRLNA